MYTIIVLFAETILFKLWSHRDICYPWHIYSFNGYWCSSVSFYWLPISMLSCQEPCSSVALHGLLYEENWDSNSPSPLVVTTELSKIINRNHAFMILEFPSSSLLLFYWGVCCRYLGGLTYLMYRLPFVECLMFGALISATDPVTVLSIFQVISFSDSVSYNPLNTYLL